MRTVIVSNVVLQPAYGTNSVEDNDELVQLEYEEIKETIRMEKEFKREAWSTLWSTKGNRHRLVILVTAGLFSQWSGNGQCNQL
jgi:hypothetical protein